jgi:transcriptional regulator with XRE-family HTH domain
MLYLHREIELTTLLAQIRKRKKVSSYVVAATLGINQGAYVHIEHGRRSISAEMAGKIAEYFDVPLDVICSPKDTRYVVATPEIKQEQVAS